MMENVEAPGSATVVRKRKNGNKKHRDAKKMKVNPGIMGKKKKISQKMQKLFRKRVREYNSDNEDENENEENVSESKGEKMEIERRGKFRKNEGEKRGKFRKNEGERSEKLRNEEDEPEHDIWTEEHEEEEEDGDVPNGFTKFAEGCRAFGMAFQAIMKSKTDDSILGPVLAAQKNKVLEKLAEEDAERKAKGEAKKEKHLIEEKGHIMPANFLDSHEKFLIGVATKGVVKLFNAVNKAQNAQKGLNPSRFKDTKALTKRRKEAFFSELKKTSAQSVDTTMKESTPKGGEDNSQPAWAPLRDTFMLTNTKLKDWDKMADQSDI